MKVMHLVGTSRMRGAERFALHLAESLCSHGLDQEIVILKSAGNVAFPTSTVPTTSLGNETSTRFARLRALRKLLRDTRPAVVLCHGLPALKHARFAALGLPSPPALAVKKIGLTSPWIHGFATFRMLYSRWALSGVDVCVVLGPEQAKEAVALLRVPVHKLVHIPNARPAPAIQCPPQRVSDLILMVGALSEEKQPWIGLTLLRHLHDQGNQARLRFVGEGPLRWSLEDRAAEMGLFQYVEFAGQEDAIWPHYFEASMLFLCSRTEGVPGVAIEAALSGLPVVTWAVGDVGAVVEHGVTGLVAPYGDSESILRFGYQLMSDSILRARLGEEALRRSPEFTMDSVAQKYADLLRATAQEKFHQ